MQKRWFVTWRHTDESPLNALVQMRDTKEEAEELQRRYLESHSANLCCPCSRLSGEKGYINGRNDFIVTKVRTEKAVYRTLGFTS